jgi:hypothetical protein
VGAFWARPRPEITRYRPRRGRRLRARRCRLYRRSFPLMPAVGFVPPRALFVLRALSGLGSARSTGSLLVTLAVGSVTWAT